MKSILTAAAATGLCLTALPAQAFLGYGNYVARAQASEGVVMMSALVPAMMNAAADGLQGEALCSSSAAWFTQEVERILVSSKYIASIDIVHDSRAQECILTATFRKKGAGIKSKLAGKALQLHISYDEKHFGNSKCTNTAPNRLPADITPAKCQ